MQGQGPWIEDDQQVEALRHSGFGVVRRLFAKDPSARTETSVGGCGFAAPSRETTSQPG